MGGKEREHPILHLSLPLREPHSQNVSPRIHVPNNHLYRRPERQWRRGIHGDDQQRLVEFDITAAILLADDLALNDTSFLFL